METIWIIIIILAIIYFGPLLKKLWTKHKPEALKRKQAERSARDMHEKAAAISHVNGLLEAVAWNENKTKLIIKIIDRIGFSELEKNMFLARKYHAGFAVPEKANTKKIYLKDWVEVMAVNGELSNPEYRFCCDMATKYECSADVIKEIMDELGITVTSTMKPTDWLKEIETIIYDYCEQAYHSKPNFRIKPYTNFKINLNFDGIDMSEIAMAFEKKFNVKIPDNHPINQRLADDTDFTVEYFLSAYGLCDGVTDKNKGNVEEDGNNLETITINNTSSSKLARPKFTDEEAFAMGTLALSLADINQGTAMMVFMREYEGYTAGDVKRIMADATTNINKALLIFMRMTDPFKKSYAAGFFASLIKASGAMDDADSIRVWRNCLETALHHHMSFEDAVKWYEGCEHGKK